MGCCATNTFVTFHLVVIPYRRSFFVPSRFVPVAPAFIAFPHSFYGGGQEWWLLLLGSSGGALSFSFMQPAKSFP